MTEQQQIEEEQRTAEEQVAAAEQWRTKHERRSFDTSPLTGIVDYGTSGQISELAMAHLRESIPDGQKHRTEEAYRALVTSVRITGLWLRRKGLNV
jgi:hypothetical protein